MDNSILMPDKAVEHLWKKVPEHIKLAFVSAFVLGLVTHLYMFANKLPNHDDTHHLFQADYGTPSGRWFLPTVLSWDGNFSMPWLIGILGLFCLALTTCLVVALFRIKRPLGIIVTAGLLVSFPSVAATYTYMFTADAYFFGLFLAALGAYCTDRFTYVGIPLGIVLICLSLGIYQSYYPVAIVLLVGALLFETMAKDLDFGKLFLKGVKMVGVLLLAMASYMAMVRVTTRDTGLADYMGISSMGQIEPADLPQLLLKCYTEYESYFLMKDGGFYDQGIYFGIVPYLLIAALACTLILLLLVLFERKLGVARTLLVLVLVAIYPLAADMIHVMIAGSNEIHQLMLYGVVFVLVLPVALASYAADHVGEAHPTSVGVQAGLSWFLMLTMMITSFSYMVADNKAYLKMEVAFDQIYAYSNRLITAVENTEGYYIGMPVALIGQTRESDELRNADLESIGITGAVTASNIRTNYTFDAFLNRYCGMANPIYLDHMALNKKLANTDTVIEMPIYPQKGSIKVVDDVMVVKMTNKPASE